MASLSGLAAPGFLPLPDRRLALEVRPLDEHNRLRGLVVRADAAEEIRQVAKEARAVIEEAYDGETLDAFSEALAPAFKNSLSPDFYQPTPAAPEAGD